MGPNALSSLADDLHAYSPALVLSRKNGAWGPEAGRFGQEVRELAAALVGYGLQPGDCAAVLGAEGYDTLRAGIAVLASGATLVPLDPTVSDDALRRVLESTAAVHAFASDERQLARILALRPDLPSLELVLLMTAAPSERKPTALLVNTALEVGAAGLIDDPLCLRRALVQGDGGSACLIVSTGAGSRIVGRDALQNLAGAIADTLGIVRAKTVLAAQPVSGIERLAAALAVVTLGATLLLPDPSERPDAGLDQHPADAILLTVPGIERLYRAWSEDIEAGSWLGRQVTRWAMQRGRQSIPGSFKHRVADVFALRALRRSLGGHVSTLHVMATPRGGAPSEVDAFFNAAGVSVRYVPTDQALPLAR